MKGGQLTNNVTINQVINVSNNSESKSSNIDEQTATIITGLVLITLGTFYLFFREEILNTIFYSTILILSIWSGGVLHSIVRGYFSGIKWIVFFICIALFCVACSIILNQALAPNYAPDYFVDSQLIINKYGLKGLWAIASFADIKWFVFHLIGVIGLFWAKSRVALLTLHFVTVANGIVFSDNTKSLFVPKARKFTDFGRNLFLVLIITLASYFLVSGDFFIWLEYSFPEQAKSFIDIILNGRR